MKLKLFPLILGGLGIGTTEFVMMGLLPDIAKEFHLTIPQAGHIISAYAVGVVLGAPLLVMATRSMSPKKILFGLMAMFTIFNTLSAFAPNEIVLFFARLCSGLPHGAFYGIGSVVASRMAPKGKQAQAIALTFVGITVANLVTVPFGTYIGHHYSWRYTFCGVGFIGLCTMASIYFILPSVPVARTENIKAEFKILSRPEPWLVCLITAIGTGGLFCWLSYIAPLMTEVSHFTGTQVAYVLIVAGFGMVAGNIAGGKLADKLEPLKCCIVLLLGMALTLLLIYMLSWNPIASLILTFIAGSFSMAIASPIQLLMIESSKGAEMLGASLTQAAFNIGNALGAFLGGLPIAAGFGYTSPELVGIAMSLGGVGFAWIMIKRQSGSETTALEIQNL